MTTRPPAPQSPLSEMQAIRISMAFASVRLAALTAAGKRRAQMVSR